MTVRPAKKTDYPAVGRLLLQISRLHNELRPDIFFPVAPKYNEKQYAKLLKSPDTPILVAENEAGEVVGYAMCQMRRWKKVRHARERSMLWVDDLCVDEACRGQGVGARLMESVAALARQRGAGAVELNVWECNRAALRFYEKLGFATQRRVMELPLE